MNESKPEKLRYWIALMFVDMSVGHTFKPGVLHLTLAPWLVSDRPDEEILESFRNAFSGESKFIINISRQAMFGPKKDVPVNLVEPVDRLVHLHQQALKWFEQIDARWAVKTPHVGDDFIPHIRRRSKTDLGSGSEIYINSISLIEASRQEGDERRVAEKINLK